MRSATRTLSRAIARSALLLIVVVGTAGASPGDPDTETTAQVTAANPCNPCAGNPCNPCAKNPCNPCGTNPCNPCGGAKIDPARFKQPESAQLAAGSRATLEAEGERLWNDRSLGESGIACATCHYGKYGQMADTFDESYPHFVSMPHQRAGVNEVAAAEMVNFCMLVPMQDEPLAWDSRELAALTAYVEKIQSGFEPGMGGGSSANPCNPCSAANPCNPCNPCAGR